MLGPTFKKIFEIRERFSTIVVCDMKVLGIVGVVAGKILKKKCILRAESRGEFDGSFATQFDERPSRFKSIVTALLVLLRNRVLLRADKFLSISTSIRNELVNKGVPESKIVAIKNGVNLERFRPVDSTEKQRLREELNLPKKVIFIYTGRLAKGKGLEYLLRAWQQAVQEADGIHLLLVGSGEGYQLACGHELRHSVSVKGLAESVTFTGAVDNVESYLRAADCFVLVSQTEALPLSLAEAAACGLPAIGSDINGIRDIIQANRNGFLVRYGDEYELKCAITKFGRKEEIRKMFGREARKIAIEKFDIDKIVEDYIELLDDSQCAGKSGVFYASV